MTFHTHRYATWLAALLAIALTACALVGCGSSRRANASAPGSTAAADTGTAPVDPRRLANDGDNEKPGDNDSDNSHDVDSDAFVDYKPMPDNHVYHDEDDNQILAFGAPATPKDAHAIAAMVERYYSVALAGNGARACSMIDSGLARATPTSYGAHGPVYLRGAKTCAAVLGRLFAHERAHLPATVLVTDVRLNGTVALAFFGSTHLPASDISLEREGSTWKIAQLLGSPLS